MSTTCKIRKLRKLSLGLLEQASTEIHTQRVPSPPNEERLITAEYLLQEAMEYVTGAWKMLATDKPKASMALSRWVLEASLNLFWAISDSDKIDEGLKSLIDEALRNEALLLEGLAKLHPERNTIYNQNEGLVRLEGDAYAGKGGLCTFSAKQD